MKTSATVKAVVPKPVRHSLRRIVGIDDLHARIDELEVRLAESRDDTWERSRTRWREASPTSNLTWDTELTGDAFINKVAATGAFGPDTDVLEIGPGYGRLLRACLDAGVGFRSYVGVDLSAENVAHLEDRFGTDTISFVNADVETVELDTDIDLVLSSLTLKHLYPSCERALANVSSRLRPGGRLAFDLIEGERRRWEHDNVTYIRSYSREEIREILGRIGFSDVSFDEVTHCPGRTRMLVVARRS
jgi:SAM-dependent methyltransferase